ncbi:hypothetical protein EDC40_103687 [Aminobacter aminovorans]|uniref:Uncharacterized protein n=1 Tax=Aminobacter aminovorans TaxID=83263 RepID=A0A380WKB7_AMIAI|nr:hypothetical protein [Aminobacter aminovorans]TCS28218.1 hypothetical protein EDC40_103687 [Aminobacter aminovorans]SUU89371.1 Uncharacterised protein [Aminobacter aminovorans]
MNSLLPKTKPTLLKDALRMKRERGDVDADGFKTIAINDFAYGLNATIEGAEWAMAQWVAKRTNNPSEAYQARRVAFLADLRAILAGTFGQREAA